MAPPEHVDDDTIRITQAHEASQHNFNSFTLTRSSPVHYCSSSAVESSILLQRGSEGS